MTTDTDTAEAPTTDRGSSQPSDFAVLSRRISAAGLLGRRPGYYILRFGLVGLAYLGGLAGFLALGDSWWQLLLAAGFAVLFGQVALLAHDLAHRQVFRGRKATEPVGMLVGNLGIGLSYGWWMDKHTRHHANPNHEELDPDVSPEILVWSTEQAHGARGITRWIGRWEAFLFFPLLTLEGLNLHVSSLRALANPKLKRRWLEGLLLTAHLAGYVAALFLVLSPGKAVLFLVIHQALWGVYMGAIFAPNHKGMPTLTGNKRPDFLRRQVLTSRNVRGGFCTDIALGGLNYQIEHHLFPSMPTPNLRKAQPIVRDYCAELGVSYTETSLFESYRQALSHMHAVGAPLRAEARANKA
ncbi:fatty acid desaturase [Tamaricihabitans halophyticus]|uniref:Fatty acid desaturase n=1 Tax=Tamaricihabitans halophyticus TaxID=1262583 RepID=A0A4R2QIW3_9PSEU|nr:acyl-CoA desaturase [Tamaricihabitans halophyticus]TCP49303.1 fatty acid desaturase [Tamaricihabitans halophyticus]